MLSRFFCIMQSRSLFCLAFCGMAALFLPTSTADTVGATALDALTFEKAMGIPGVTWMLKFGKRYETDETGFEVVAKLSHTVKNLMMGEITVDLESENEQDNAALGKVFGLKEGKDLPAFFLITKGEVAAAAKFEGLPDPASKRPATWDDDEDGVWEAPMLEEASADNLLKWMKKHGLKMPAIGTITELDDIAGRMFAEAATASSREADLAEAEKLAAGDYVSDPKAKIYVKIMKQIVAKGTGYAQSEMSRVTKILTGSVTPEKGAEFEEKLKILGMFSIEV